MKIIIVFISLVYFLQAQFSVDLVVDGFEKPIFVTSNPSNSNTLYVAEQNGIIRTVEDGNLIKEPFLNLKKQVHQPLFPGDEMGFLSFAFHPNYDINQLIFVHYNDRHDNTIVSRMKVDNNTVDIKSESIILKFRQPYSNHNGGTIEFGPDGYLYIALGDGGSSGDPENRAQDLSNIFGSIIRIDVDVDSGYLIPDTNPFINTKDARGEIWAYGLRNPWRISFDRLNGDLYIADVGQHTWEEINWIKNDDFNRNFGWNIMEGMHCYPSNVECYKTPYINPIFEYPNDAKYVKTLLGIKQDNVHGCSVTGGYIYRGENIPGIYGRYFFGDYCTGKVWSFINNYGSIEDFQDHTELILDDIGKKEFYLSSFGEDANGEIYLIDYNGAIYKIVKID